MYLFERFLYIFLINMILFSDSQINALKPTIVAGKPVLDYHTIDECNVQLMLILLLNCKCAV